MTKRKRKMRYGDSTEAHLRMAVGATKRLQTFLKRTKAALKDGDCRQAMNHLLDSAEANTEVAVQCSSARRTARRGRTGTLVLYRLQREFTNKCLKYRPD